MSHDGETSSRRRFLRTVGAAGLGALAGCPQDPPRTPTDAESPDGPGPDERTEMADDVIDVVEAGASPDGDEPTTPVLEELASDGTSLYFPPGEYLVTEGWLVERVDDLEVRGEDATMVAAEGYSDFMFAFGIPDGGSGLHVEGLTFDVSAENTGARPIHARVDDDLQVTDVTVTGQQDVEKDSMRFDVTSPEGTGVVEGLSMPDGGDPAHLVTGCYVGETHTGTIRFVDCHVAGFPDNGLYASAATGPVIVEGGRYENNNIANVRVSGPAEVRGVHVRCDTAPEGFDNMRGIRLTHGDRVLVENCTIQIDEVGGSDGAISFSRWQEGATVRDTDVVVNTDGVAGVLVKPPAGEFESGEEFPIRLENLTIAGTAGETAAIRVLERQGCLVEGSCITGTGQNRNGIECARVTESTLRDSSIAVTGDPLVLDASDVTREGLDTRELSDDADPADVTCE